MIANEVLTPANSALHWNFNGNTVLRLTSTTMALTQSNQVSVFAEGIQFITPIGSSFSGIVGDTSWFWAESPVTNNPLFPGTGNLGVGDTSEGPDFGGTVGMRHPSGTTDELFFGIDGVAIPEPSAFLSLGLLLTAICGLRRYGRPV